MATSVPSPAPQSLKLIPSHAFQPSRFSDIPYDLYELCQVVQTNSGLVQQLMESTQNTLSLSLSVQHQCQCITKSIRDEEEETRTELLATLFRELPVFSYYIQAIPEIKRIMFKRRQIRMTFRTFDTQNNPVAISGTMRYALKIFTCVFPYRELEFTGAGTPLIVGEKEVEVESACEFEFYNICFTAGSSKYPHGFFNLVIVCVSSQCVEPLVVEKVNVRLKYRKVMILKNRRKKQFKLQKQRENYL